MNTIKRFVAMMICLCLVFSLFGCGQASDGETQTDTKDYVYVAEYKKLNADSLSNVVLRENQMYYLVWELDEATQTSREILYRMDLTTLESTEIPFQKEESENVYSMAADADGNLWMMMARWDESGTTPTQSYSLQKIDSAGQVVLRQDMTAMMMEGADPEFGVYPQDMRVDDEGNLYVLVSSMGMEIFVLDAQGKKLFEISDGEWYSGFCQSADGTVFVYANDYSDGANMYMLKQLDVKTKGFGETYGGIPSGNGQLQCVPNGENTMLVTSGGSLYQYDMTTQVCQEILNWISCDINSDMIQQIAATEDGRILAFLYNYGNENSSTEAVYLTKTPASEVKQKTTLTYGTLYLDFQVREQIIEFNKTNASYRIEVEEYGSGSDGLALLNAAIISGDVPDIIDLSYGDVSSYISQGVLTDLYPLLDADDSLKREEFIPNILSLYESEEKLYGITTSFSVSSLMGKTADVGTESGWTIAEMQQLYDSMPEGALLLEYATRESMLMVLTLMGSESYIDWDAGTSSFDSQEFIQLLEFAGQFPSEENYNYAEEGTYTMISQGKLMLSEINASGVSDYLAQAALFGGEPVTCIGFPTPDGTGGAVVSPHMSFGIAESSQHKDAAWQFISGMMNYEFQKQDNWNFSIREDVLQEQFAEAMSDQVGGSWGWNDFTYEVQPATEEEIAAVRQLIDSARNMVSINEEIYEIINEEAAPYFAGQKTAAEVAKIIQGRVEIYVSENQ